MMTDCLFYLLWAAALLGCGLILLAMFALFAKLSDHHEDH